MARAKSSEFRVGLYARVSTHDQQTLPLQVRKLKEYAKHRGWMVALEVKEVASGVKDRPQRDVLINAARRRELDGILVWRLDRWGRSVTDLMNSLRELTELKVGFVSITEALDLTTSTGRAMAGLLAIFAEFEREILRERVKAGIAQARAQGKPHGRPPTASRKVKEVKMLFAEGMSKRQIAKTLEIGRTSVRRILTES